MMQELSARLVNWCKSDAVICSEGENELKVELPWVLKRFKSEE